MADKEERNLGGRPPIIETPEEFELLVEGYRQECEATGEPMTFTGMALYLGFESRQSFYDYGKRPEFSYPARKARTVIEHQYEKNLHSNMVAGSIFALKNAGWSDRQDHTHASPDGGPVEVAITYTVVDPPARED